MEKYLHEWRSFLTGPEGKDRFRELYGDHDELVQDKITLCQELLGTFEQAYGAERPLFIIRIPVRINLMGVHIEHRGGYVNYMTIGHETFMAISRREDDMVRAVNANETFEPFEFKISGSGIGGRDWLTFIDEVELEAGKWENYVKASCFYHHHKTGKDLKGMDLAVHGKAPMGAGLSSSSTLVVGTTEALAYMNGLELTKEEKTIMNGEAEWYVGTRGGAGDHAAMIYGETGMITHLQFFPLKAEMIPLPNDVSVIACNSLVSAKKAAGAKDVFNDRIASYEVAHMLLKEKFPQYQAEHLRDWNIQNLGVSQAELYRMFKVLPVSVNRQEILEMLPDAEHLFVSHKEPEAGYHVRAVALFGLAECARSDKAGELLKSGKKEEFGQLMYISHDGDRVTENGQKFEQDFTDQYLDRLIAGAEAGDPACDLALQPGGYDCSTPELDLIVDIAKNSEGVYGAGLTGGGLGGMVLALVDKTRTDHFLKRLDKYYYSMQGLAMSAEECVPAAGVSIL